MAKVFGMHMIDLRPGVKGDDFEKFFREKAAPVPFPAGWKWYLLKGERGDKEGKYLVMFEIESLEARDRVTPELNQGGEEAIRFHEVQKAVFDEWEKLASGLSDPSGTDYVVVAG